VSLLLLTLLNLFNYLDRYVIAGLLPRIETEFGISHTQAGILGSLFIGVYMVASPLGGYLGDRLPRRWVVAGAGLLWSFATLGSGLSQSFMALLVARALIGLGEAGYGTVAPSLLCDLYPRERRTRALSIFYVAMPLGAALGYGLGGAFSQSGDWRRAFFVAGLPGLLLAALALRLPEPSRGQADEVTHSGPLDLKAALRQVTRNARFWINTGGQTLMTFSVGGLSFWMPTFLERERGMASAQAGLGVGAVTALAGILGTLAGGWLGARWSRFRDGGLLLSGVAFALAALPMAGSALFLSPTLIFTSIFLSLFLVFTSTGPINSALMESVPPSVRGFAMGLSILVLHLLGDAISPPLIGRIAEKASFSAAVLANAVPLGLAGVLLIVGQRAVARIGNS
jgi:predicted MFS family arabinose efflux permease